MIDFNPAPEAPPADLIASSNPDLPSPELGAAVGGDLSAGSSTVTSPWVRAGGAGGGGAVTGGGGGGGACDVIEGGGGAIEGGGGGGATDGGGGGGGIAVAGGFSPCVATAMSVFSPVVASPLMSGRSPMMSSGRSAILRVGTIAGPLSDS